MKPGNLFLQYGYLRLKRPQGQIAALFIVLIAVVFIFMAIVINIGRIGVMKTGLDNAVDAATLAAASMLGSYTSVLNQQVRCASHWDFGLLGKFIGFIVALFTFNIPAIFLSFYTIASHNYNDMGWWFGSPQLNNLDFPDRVTATATAYVLSSMVEDPNKTIDVNDLDQDGINNDEIPMYAEWWDKHVAALKSNLLMGMKDWNSLMGYTDANGNFIEGPVSEFEKKIDGNFTYPDGTKGQGGYGDDYGIYLYLCDPDPCAENPCDTTEGACTHPCRGGDCGGPGPWGACYAIPCSRTQHIGFIPLLGDLMTRYYLGQDSEASNVDADKFHFPEILNNIHFKITDVTNTGGCSYADFRYNCGRTGSHFNTKTYQYDGIWTEGSLGREYSDNNPTFNASQPDCNTWDKVDEMRFQFNDFLTYVEDMRDAKKFAELNPEQVLSIFLNPNPDEDPSCGRRAFTRCKASYYTMLQGWQSIILDWRTKLIAVENAILSKVNACKAECTNNCLILRNSSDPFNLVDACRTVIGNIALATKIGTNLEYDKNVGDFCLSRCSALHSPYCGCQRGEMCWDCYSRCYGEMYWQLHPFVPNSTEPPDPDWEKYWSQCFRDTNLFGSHSYSSPWGRGQVPSLPPCDTTCFDSCDVIYDTEWVRISSDPLGPPPMYNQFSNEISEALRRIGDPNNPGAGGLYWDIQNLLDAMSDTYTKIKALIDSTRKRSVYGWKDTQGWHLTMVEVGSFPVPTLYLTQDSSWLGLYKTECINLSMNGDPYVDVWAWRYDQAKEISLAGKGNLPWWKFQYGRKQNIVEPAFMSDNNKNSWLDLDLLNPDSPDLKTTECFLCKNGLRSHSKAHFGANQTDINITDAGWTSPNFCLSCP